MLNQNKCAGCGAIKQIDDINKVGYVKDLSHKYCLECHSLANYGKVINHFNPSNYENIKSGSLVLIISSIIHLDQIFFQPISKIAPNANYVYIINQIDLLPKETNLNYLNSELVKLFKQNNVLYDNLIFMSALKKSDINNLRDFILKRSEKDVYLFGYQNSGKTTILKALTNNKDALNLSKAGLTQEVITEEFGNKTLYDLPGTYTKGFLADFMSYESYNKLLLKKTIKPKIYQLKNTNKLVINDFIEIKIKGTLKQSLVFYLSEHNKIMKYNLENNNNYLNTNYTYLKKTFKISNKKQITIADFIILFAKDNYSLEITYPKNMKVTIMESLFK